MKPTTRQVIVGQIGKALATTTTQHNTDNTRQQLQSLSKETVDHPSHYNKGKYEVIDVIEDWRLGFHLGNVLKYIARAEHKHDAIEDLKKAAWYLNRFIEIQENKMRGISCDSSKII